MGGAIQAPNAGAVPQVRACAPALRQLRAALRTSPTPSLGVADAFRVAAAAPVVPAATTPEAILEAAFAHIMAADALRVASSSWTAGSVQIKPQFPESLAAALFPALAQNEGLEAVEGLLAGLSHSRNASGAAPIPVRAHIFYRNLQGLWVCTNPGCTQAPPRNAAVPAGALHYTPALTCGCGSRILELLYCEACGEIYFGGYRRPAVGGAIDPALGLNPGEWYLVPTTQI